MLHHIPHLLARRLRDAVPSGDAAYAVEAKSGIALKPETRRR